MLKNERVLYNLSDTLDALSVKLKKDEDKLKKKIKD